MGTDRSVLSRLADEASSSGIFCDFDGCLAPIVPDPDDARALEGADEVLERLAGIFRIVAVVSGRSVADLAGRVGARGVRLVGLHGMEELRDGRVLASSEAEAARTAIDRAGALLERSLGAAPGALLERKGLALAVHFRRAPDPDAVERIAEPLVRAAADAEGLAVVSGRRILEVRPRAGGDKGDAVRRVVEEEKLRGALFGGDDVGDLPAFRVLDGLDTAVRVAVASVESPPELTERADLVVDSPQAFLSLLDALAREAASG
jgi:trehalose 6-phosphate phosphatase